MNFQSVQAFTLSHSFPFRLHLAIMIGGSLNGLRAFRFVHYKWVLVRDVAAIMHFSLVKTNVVAVFRLLDIRECSDLFENFDCFFCLLDAFSGVTNNKGELQDKLNALIVGEDEGRNDGGNGEGNNYVALLVHVNLPVLVASDLG